MATLEEIARLAGVSTGTVSRVLNGKSKNAWPSSLKRAEHIHQIAKKLKYHPSASARAMANRRTHQLGVLLRNAPDELHRYRFLDAYEMILGLNERLETEGYVLSIARIGDVERGPEESRVFRERVLEGMFLIDALPEPVLRRVREIVPTCIWLDANSSDAAGCVRRDEHYAGRLVGDQLANAGYRRLVWVDFPERPNAHYSHAHRRDGLLEAGKAHALAVEQFNVPPEGFGEHVDRLRELLRPDTAVVAFNTSLATRIAHAAPQWRKLVGVDFGLACCDDNHTIEINWPELACVHTDRFAMGKIAAEMMIVALEQPGSPIAPQTLRGQWRPGSTAQGPDNASGQG